MWCFWTSKGGSGCSVVAAAAGVRAALEEPVLLVDLDGGDLATILGVESPIDALADWMTCDEPPPDAVARMELPVSDRLSLLPWRGSGVARGTAEPSIDRARIRPDRGELLARLLAVESRRVIVDLGLLSSHSGPCRTVDHKLSVLAMARRSSLVIRPCYLAIGSAIESVPADDVVLVVEPGRALRPADVSSALAIDDLAVVRWDPAVARAVDAGLLGHRLPRPLRRIPRAHREPAFDRPGDRREEIR